MLDNPGDANVKRYVPPQSRNRLLNRRKSGDRSESANYLHGNEGEKNIVSSSRDISATNHGEASRCNLQNESPQKGLIAVDGCCSSKAAQLMNERWAAAMHSYNDPSVDATERPIMYSGSGGSAWGSSKLSHQMDFAAELQRAISSSNAGKTPKARD